jgi:tetratricopeptide (TPR) repeat protein
MLSTVYRKRNEYVEAMLHCWHAFDLIPPGDVRRLELVVALASIAHAAGDQAAARRGFEQVLEGLPPLRIHIAAVDGLANVAYRSAVESSRHQRSFDEAIEVLQKCRHLLAQSLPPHERASLLLSTARLERLVGESSNVLEHLTEAESLSGRYHLHELSLELERERERASEAHQPLLAEVMRNRPFRRHAALSRLLELQAL